MNHTQRESIAKYLYDISKGIVLVAVIKNLTAEGWDIMELIVGAFCAVGFLVWAYIMEGGIKDE